MPDDLKLTRQMWYLLEPVHAVLYYAPEAFDEAETLGYSIDTRWPSYFAWRSAPFGNAGRHLVASTFFSFSPRKVGDYIPSAWSIAAPDEVLEARLRAVDRALRTLLGARVEGPEVAEAARLVREAAQAASTEGRPLAAANADLPWPEAPHLALWHAATVLREQRGDGHVAALQVAGLDPCEALVSFAAVGAAPPEVFASRGWTDEEWKAARERLIARGWVHADGSATERGHEARDVVERQTDELAAEPWRTLGAATTGKLAQLLMPIMQMVVQAGILPRQSTLGMNRTMGAA
jgi:hypothetical protein